MSYRILLADGHWLIRRGLRAALHQVGDLVVVGEAMEQSQLLEAGTAADLLIVDEALGPESGLAAVRRLKMRDPRVKVLLTSRRGGEVLVRDALDAGCDGYVRVEASEAELFEAIRTVRSGGVYLDAEMTRQFVLAVHRRETRASAHPLDCLSPRELSVFRLVVSGLTNRGVAEQMQLSHKTVEKYRASMMQKLRLRTALDLRLFALEIGAVPTAQTDTC